MLGNLISVVDNVNFHVHYLPNTSTTQKLRDQFMNIANNDKQRALKESIYNLF